MRIVSQRRPNRFFYAVLNEISKRLSQTQMLWSAVTGLHREGELGLWKGASSKKALHVIIISDRRGLGHLCSTEEQNGRLPFRCQKMLANGKIQGAQEAERHFPPGHLYGKPGTHRKPRGFGN